MKNRMLTISILFFISLQLLSFKCNNTEKEVQEISNETLVDSDKFAKIVFEKTRHEFGDIQQGETVMYAFKYKNTGDTDLMIRNVRASCGCTLPKWSKKPLPPNGEDEIVVEFNTTGRHDFQQKTIRIFANIDEENEEVRVSFTANVVVPKQEEE